MLHRFRLTASRLLDIVFAVTGLVLLAPVIFAVAVAVVRTSPGPAIHRARRVGVDGELFTLYKFRSMSLDAATTGPGVTASDDRRITSVGGFLRHRKLDELPQLWNVLRGDMAIVGPRPEDPRYVETYTPDERQILAFRPGITSPASVKFRREESLLAGGTDLEQRYRTVMSEKIRIDLDYFSRRTILGDLGWIVRTLGAVFSDGEVVDG